MAKLTVIGLIPVPFDPVKNRLNVFDSLNGDLILPVIARVKPPALDSLT